MQYLQTTPSTSNVFPHVSQCKKSTQFHRPLDDPPLPPLHPLNTYSLPFTSPLSPIQTPYPFPSGLWIPVFLDFLPPASVCPNFAFDVLLLSRIAMKPRFPSPCLLYFVSFSYVLTSILSSLLLSSIFSSRPRYQTETCCRSFSLYFSLFSSFL